MVYPYEPAPSSVASYPKEYVVILRRYGQPPAPLYMERALPVSSGPRATVKHIDKWHGLVYTGTSYR